jgi:putative ABC transport system ATP-binding protein
MVALIQERSPLQFPVLTGRDLHLCDVSISYKTGSQTVEPVKEFNLYAASNRITALIGRSGSGKTSLLSCMAGLLTPSHGAIWLGGIEVSTLKGKPLDEYRRHHVGVIHQAYNLIPSLSVVENVIVPLRLAGVPRRESTERAEGLLAEVGMSRFSKRHPSELSGGQQQRVAVARALATNPTLVLADEPTAHLDGAAFGDVRDLLRAIADSGRTVIVATHDDRLLSLADQAVQL